MNEEIMNVNETENEEVIDLVPAEEYSEEECGSGTGLFPDERAGCDCS